MSSEQIATAVINLFFLGALLWLLYGPWQETVNAILRANLLKIRDEILDMPFEGPARQEIRRMLNGIIRHAGLFAWPRILILALFIKSDRHEKIDRLLGQIEDQEARQKIRRLIEDALKTVAGAMLLRSPILMALSVLFSPVLLIVLILNHTALKRYYWRLLDFVRPEMESDRPTGPDDPLGLVVLQARFLTDAGRHRRHDRNESGCSRDRLGNSRSSPYCPK